MDWRAWHGDYDDPSSSLSRRRRTVQREINRWLDSRPAERLRVVSACAGDGRDLLEVLAGRRDSARVRARLLEIDPELASLAREQVTRHGLDVEVLELDAGSTDSYAPAVPADLVMWCGVFGNLSAEDVDATIAVTRSLCAPGAEPSCRGGSSSRSGADRCARPMEVPDSGIRFRPSDIGGTLGSMRNQIIIS